MLMGWGLQDKAYRARFCLNSWGSMCFDNFYSLMMPPSCLNPLAPVSPVALGPFHNKLTSAISAFAYPGSLWREAPVLPPFFPERHQPHCPNQSSTARHQVLSQRHRGEKWGKAWRGGFGVRNTFGEAWAWKGEGMREEEECLVS